jgi:hypothetical protein
VFLAEELGRSNCAYNAEYCHFVKDGLYNLMQSAMRGGAMNDKREEEELYDDREEEEEVDDKRGC